MKTPSLTATDFEKSLQREREILVREERRKKEHNLCVSGTLNTKGVLNFTHRPGVYPFQDHTKE